MELITLINGVRLVIVPLTGLKAVTVEVHLGIGSKYETKDEAGLSHFLEHMAFKGTTKRPNPIDIFREMDSVGADFDAETGYEDTAYRITTIRSNLEWAAEMLSDILLDSVMDETEVVKERGVVAEEIKMYKDNPMMGLGSELVKFLYGRTDIGCWNISGKLSDIEKITLQSLLNYRRKHFDTNKMVVVVAGNVSITDKDLLLRYFGRFVATDARPIPEVNIRLNSKQLYRGTRNVEQAHFALAVPTFGSRDERRYALKLLEVALVGNTSSRLFEEIRSKRGWAYYVFSVSENLIETGYWGVQAGVASSKLDEAIELVESEILGIEGWLDWATIERSKTYLNGKIELMLDRSDFWSGYIGKNLLSRNVLVDPQTELSKINSVQLTEIVDLVRQYFVKSEVRKYIVAQK